MEVRGVKTVLPQASERRICRVLGVSRSGSRPIHKNGPGNRNRHEGLENRLLELIRLYPAFGYRRLWALLRFREKYVVNVKTVHRLLQKNGWQVNSRIISAKPRVKSSRSQAKTSNERWATDITHIPCGVDGWGHLVAVLDCHDREVVGYEFALRGRSKEAELALENACLHRFGTLRPALPMPVLRSDNGLVFQSRNFRAVCHDYRLSQEFITPYTPEQNGMIERFFRSLKEECVWQHNFQNFQEASRVISHWLSWYNHGCPHQALGYKSPAEFRAQQLQLVA
jgi:putative transposase